MSLLPLKFQAPAALPLGPVVRPAPAAPVMHVHDWRPAASSKAHAVCSCGQVALRELVMPPEPPAARLMDDGQGDDWDGLALVPIGEVYESTGPAGWARLEA